MLTRRGLYLALSIGVLLATFFWRWRREPCRELGRLYEEAYAAMQACGSDTDCVLDTPATTGPLICDPVRAVLPQGRDRLLVIERNFEARGCAVKPPHCTPALGARCDHGRCVARR